MIAIVLLSVFLLGMIVIGTWGLPQMVQKFYAIKSESVILKAAIVTTVFSLSRLFTFRLNSA
jgi:solute:Na+ symporter, SSS family